MSALPPSGRRRGVRAVVGIGASTPPAARRVRRALIALDAHPSLEVSGESQLSTGPGRGGATLDPFVNAAAVVVTALGPSALMRELLAMEHKLGRLRTRALGPRTLDLDLLWIVGWSRPFRAPGVVVPHPRVGQRPFAVLPALEALDDAGEERPTWLTSRPADPWLRRLSP